MGTYNRKSSHNTTYYRRDEAASTTTYTYDYNNAPVEDYKTNYADCWFSDIDNKPYKTYWAERAR